MRTLASIVVALVTVGTIAVSHAQQPAAPAGEGRGQAPAVPAQGAGRGAPTAPPGINWPSPPLPDGPILEDTGIVHQIRIVPTKGFNQPFAMAFLPDGSILVTERPGCLRLVRNGVLDPTHVTGLPPIQAAGLAGLMDIALHPRFSENQLVYLTYHRPAPGNPGTSTALQASGRCSPPDAANGAGAGRGANAGGGRGAGGGPGTITLARGRWSGNALVDVKDIFSAIASGNASRIVFGKDGTLYMTVGFGDIPPPYVNAAAAASQDPNSLAGKVLRLKDDGSVPSDNPFVGRAGYRPEIYTMGHRNSLGLAVQPDTGAIWESENGPNGGDEINLLQAGKNYGWPIVSYGRFYLGPRVNTKAWQEGMEDPVVFWVPAIATSGLAFYTGDRFPQWKGNLFAGGMRQGEVPRSGHLERIDFNEKWEELHRESFLRELQQRIRDVRQGPDGLLYVLTAETEGALLRLEPASAPVAVGRGSR
jgi:glucose/arabinose dehydrogenase